MVTSRVGGFQFLRLWFFLSGFRFHVNPNALDNFSHYKIKDLGLSELIQKQTNTSPHVRESKTYSLGFWIPRHGFRILTTGFEIFFSGPWIPDSNCSWDSGFIQLYSGFQGSGFLIPQTKFSKILDSTGKNFRDSGIRIPLHGAKYNKTTTKVILWH